MNPKDRVTTLAEVFKRKVSPGPSSYKTEEKKLKLMKSEVSVKVEKAEYLSKFAEIAESKKSVPLNFQMTALEKTKVKPRYTTIDKGVPRFKPDKAEKHPNPASYKPLDSFKKAVLPNKERGNQPAWSGPSNYKEGFKPKVSVFIENIHKYKRGIPGAVPSKRNYDDYKKLSPSPSLKKCRH